MSVTTMVPLHQVNVILRLGQPVTKVRFTLSYFSHWKAVLGRRDEKEICMEFEYNGIDDEIIEEEQKKR